MIEIPITQARKSLFFMSSFGSDTPFMLLAKLKVKKDKVAEYLEIADKTDKAVEAEEPGMLHHTFDQDPDDPLRFVWSEVYKNDDALLFGREDLGLPEEIKQSSNSICTIEMPFMKVKENDIGVINLNK